MCIIAIPPHKESIAIFLIQMAYVLMLNEIKGELFSLTPKALAGKKMAFVLSVSIFFLDGFLLSSLIHYLGFLV